MSSQNRPWGIDVEGRPMRYEPWPTDLEGRYRSPTAEERIKTWGIGGEAVRETLIYFQDCGGDLDLLTDQLNKHAVSELFRIDSQQLLDPDRWYNNEYWFYVVMFTKRLIGRYDFHFGEGTAVQLSDSHRIYEKGFLDFEPYGSLESEVSIGILHAFVAEWEAFIPDFALVTQWAALLADEKNGKDFLHDIYPIEDAWICSELQYYIHEFALVLTNSNDTMQFIKRVTAKLKNSAILWAPKTLLSFVIEKHITSTSSIYEVRVSEIRNGLSIDFQWCSDYDQRKFSHYSAGILTNTANVLISSIVTGLKSSLGLPEDPPFRINSRLDSESVNFTIDIKPEIPWRHLFLFGVVNLTFLAITLVFGGVPFPGLVSLMTMATLGNLSLFLMLQLRSARKALEISERTMAEKVRQEERYYRASKTVASELLKEKQELELHVDERTKELKSANDRLQALDRAKTHFFANVSHELKTPIALIRAPLEALRHGEYGRQINPDHPVFSLMERNVDRLFRLTGQLLDTARLESGYRGACLPIRLGETLELWLSSWGEAARTQGLTLLVQGSGDPVVQADPEALETLVFNLLSNALKYTSAPGTIEVSWGTEGDLAVLQVRDTGIGIPADQQEGLFQRFHRIYENRRLTYEGTGLGLSISREIARSHGGDLTCTSVEGKGSCFTATLPLAGPEGLETVPNVVPRTRWTDVETGAGTTGQPSPPGTCPEADQPVLLLIEDNRDLREFLTASLLGEWRVVPAGDGVEAWVLLEGGLCPQVILSDLMMPGLDGLELLKRIREAEAVSKVPVLFLTAWNEPEIRIEGLRAGAMDFIGKPFSLEEVRLKLRNALPTSSAQSAVSQTLEPALTDRETDISRLLLEGLSDKEIASRLNLSPRTVSTVLSRIYRKTGAGSRFQLIRLFQG